MSASAIPACSVFEPMLTPATLEYLRSKPELYGYRSYAYMAQQESPEAYRAWLEQQEDKIFLTVYPVFATAPYGDGSGRSDIYHFDGVSWRCDSKTTMYCFIRTNLPSSRELKSETALARIVGDLLESKRLEMTDEEKCRFYGDPENFVIRNGTLVLEDGQFVLKPSLPDDFQNYYSDIEWSTYDFDSPLVKELLAWFRKAFGDVGTVFSFLDYARSVLSDKIEPAFWYGTGENSKSSMLKLFHQTFGHYFHSSSEINYTARIWYNPHWIPGKDTSQKKITVKDSFNDQSNISITNIEPILPEHAPPCRIFTFVGRWEGDERDPYFHKKIPKLAPAFLWLLTRADIYEYLG